MPTRSELAALVRAEADRQGVDPELISSMVMAESTWDPRAVGKNDRGEATAFGLMQLTPGTARRYGVKNPFDASQNVRGGVSYMKDLLGMFDGDRRKAVGAYHAGEGTIQRHGGIPTEGYPKTNAYVNKVLGGAQVSDKPGRVLQTGQATSVQHGSQGKQTLGEKLWERRQYYESLRKTPEEPKGPVGFDQYEPQEPLQAAPQAPGMPGAPAAPQGPPAQPEAPSQREQRAPRLGGPYREEIPVPMGQAGLMKQGILDLPGEVPTGPREIPETPWARLRPDDPHLLKGPITAGEKWRSAAFSALHGAAEFPASVADWFGDAAYEIDRLEEEYTKSLPPVIRKAIQYGPGLGFRMMAPGLPAMPVPMIEAFRKDPKAKEAADYYMRQAGEVIRKTADKLFPKDRILKGMWWQDTIPHGAGMAAAFFGAGWLGKAPAASGWLQHAAFPAVMGAMTQGAQGYAEAEQFKADPNDKLWAFILNTGIGVSEGGPVGDLLHRMDKGTGGAVRRIVANTVAESLEEFFQELTQQLGSNTIAKFFYDEERKLSQGVMRGAYAGGTVGGGLGAVATLLQIAMGRRRLGISRNAPRATDLHPQPDEDMGTGGDRTIADETAMGRIQALYEMDPVAVHRFAAEVLGPEEYQLFAPILQSIAAKASMPTEQNRLTEDETNLWFWLTDQAEVKGINPRQITAPPGAKGTPIDLSAILEQQKAQTKSDLMSELQSWEPWITRSEIEETRNPEALVRTAKSRMAAYRESYLLSYATPEERGSLNEPGAARHAILKSIEQRLAKPYGPEMVGVEEEGAQVGPEPVPTIPQFMGDIIARQMGYPDGATAIEAEDEAFVEIMDGVVGPEMGPPAFQEEAPAPPEQEALPLPPEEAAPPAPVEEAEPPPARLEPEVRQRRGQEDASRGFEGNEQIDLRQTEPDLEKRAELAKALWESVEEGDMIVDITGSVWVIDFGGSIGGEKQGGKTSVGDLDPTGNFEPDERRWDQRNWVPAAYNDLMQGKLIRRRSETIAPPAPVPPPPVEEAAPPPTEPPPGFANEEEARRAEQDVKDFFGTEQWEGAEQWQEAGEGITEMVEEETGLPPGTLTQKPRIRDMQRDKWLGSMDPMTRDIMEHAPFSAAHLAEQNIDLNTLRKYLNDRSIPHEWVISEERGKALDEIAQEISSATGRDITEGTIADTLRALTEQRAIKGKKSSRFGTPDPDLSVAAHVPVEDLKLGQSFVAVDNREYTVTAVKEGKTTLSYFDPQTEKDRKITLPEGELVPLYMDTSMFSGAEEIAIPKTRDYGATAPPEGKGGWGRYAAEATSPLQSLPQNVRDALVKFGIGEWTKGNQTQAAMVSALTTKFGPKVGPYAEAVFAKVSQMPLAKRPRTRQIPLTTVPSPEGGERAPEPAPSPPREPTGPVPPEGVPEGAPRPSPGPTETRPETKLQPEAKPTEKVVTKEKPRVVNPHGVQSRRTREGGIATLGHELLPPVSEDTVDVWYPAAEVKRLSKLLGRTPLVHQLENSVRAIRAFLRGHGFVFGDSTGTGKTTVNGLIVDRLMKSKPKAKVLYVLMNRSLMQQAKADVFERMNINTTEYKGHGQFSGLPRTVHFMTYKRLQMEKDADGIKLIQGWDPDLIIFDESQELRNAYRGNVVRADAARDLMESVPLRARPHVLFTTATPFESILHTRYVYEALRLGKPDEPWSFWLKRAYGISWDADQEVWQGLSRKKLAQFFEDMYKHGLMIRNEIDFGALKSKKGKSLSLTSRYVFAEMTDAQRTQSGLMNDAFTDLFQEIENMPKSGAIKRVAGGMRYLFRRAMDENLKIAKAVSSAQRDLKEGKSVVFALFRKGGTSVDAMMKEWEAGEREWKGPMQQVMTFLRSYGIEIDSPIQTLRKLFPESSVVTGDQPAGSKAREAHIDEFMKNVSKTLIMTVHAGGVGMSAHDTIGNAPRSMYVVTAPDTALQMVQLAGRTFRLGSQSSADIHWVFLDNPSDHKLADKIAQRLGFMKAINEGAVKVPEADELEGFDFPEIEATEQVTSEAGALAGMAPEGPLGLPAAVKKEDQEEMFGTKEMENVPGQIEAEKRRRAVERYNKEHAEEAEWPADTLFGRDQIEETKKRQRGLLEEEPGGKKPEGLPAVGKRPWNPEGAQYGFDPNEPQKNPAKYNYGFIPGVHVVPESGKEDMLKARKKMADDLAAALNTVLRRGKVPGKKSIRGVFWPWHNVARMRLIQDIEYSAHEMGHRLSQLMFGMQIEPGQEVRTGSLLDATAKDLKAFYSELKPLASPDVKGQKGTIGEGFAEFIRMWVTRPEQAVAQAPRFERWLTNKLKADMPDIYNAFRGIRSEYLTFIREGSAAGRTLTTIGTAAGITHRMPMDATTREWRRIWEDDSFPVRYYSNFLLDLRDEMYGRKIRRPSAAGNPAILSSTVSDRHALASQMIHVGQFKYHQPDRIIGPSLLSIMKRVDGLLGEYEVYAKAKRAKNLQLQRKMDPFESVGIYEKDMDEILAAVERGAYFGPSKMMQRLAANGKLFQSTFKEKMRYERNLLQYLVDAGMLSQEAKIRIEKGNVDYSPLIRLVEAEGRNPFDSTVGAKEANIANPLKKLTGADIPTLNSFEATMRNTQIFVDRAHRNAVSAKMLDIAEMTPGGGKDVAEAVKQNVTGIPVTLSEVFRRLADEHKIKKEDLQKYLDGSRIPQDLMEEMVAIFRPSWFTPKAPYQWVWRHGHRQFAWFNPQIYESLQFIDRRSLVGIGKISGLGVKALRSGAIVYWPPFWLRSVLRDVPVAAIQSESLPSFLFNLPMGFVDALFDTSVKQKYMRSGGYTATFIRENAGKFMRTLENNLLKQDIAIGKASYWKWYRQKVWTAVKQIHWTAAHIGNSLELGPRIAEARVRGLVKAKGLSQMLETGYAGREANVDFNRMGSYIRNYTRHSAFLGVRIGGYTRAAREFRHHKVRALMRMFMLLGIPTLISYLYHRDDDRWRQVDQKIRDNNFVFFIPKSLEKYVPKEFRDPISWPKPHVYGDIMTFFERLLEAIDKDDPTVMDELQKNMIKQTPMWTSWMPTVLQPTIEVIANQKFYSGAPVRPSRGEPGEQYWAYTAPVMRDLGRMMGYSGASLEHWVRQTTGGLGGAVIKGISQIYERNYPEIQPGQKLPMTPADLPVVGGLFAHYPTTSDEPVNRFYMLYEPASQVVQSMGQKKTREPIMFGKYLTEKIEGKVAYSLLQPFHVALGKMRSEWYRIASEATGDDKAAERKKRTRLREISKDMNEIASAGVEAAGRLEKERGVYGKVIHFFHELQQRAGLSQGEL